MAKKKSKWIRPKIKECIHNKHGRMIMYGSTSPVFIFGGKACSHYERFWTCAGCRVPMDARDRPMLHLGKNLVEERV